MIDPKATKPFYENGSDGVEFIFDIDCSSDAKGARLQARCDTTITGIRWTLTGDLAKCIAAMLVENFNETILRRKR